MPHIPERNGDFSGRANFTLKDPLGGTFANNIIPQARFDRIGKASLRLTQDRPRVLEARLHHAGLLAEQHGAFLDALALAHEHFDDPLVRLRDEFQSVPLERTVHLGGSVRVSEGSQQEQRQRNGEPTVHGVFTALRARERSTGPQPGRRQQLRCPDGSRRMPPY